MGHRGPVGRGGVSALLVRTLSMTPTRPSGRGPLTERRRYPGVVKGEEEEGDVGRSEGVEEVRVRMESSSLVSVMEEKMGDTHEGMGSCGDSRVSDRG